MIPTIKVYGGRGGSSLRVHWMLAECGLAYETMPVDINSGENKQPAFLAMNPAGQVPVITIDEVTLAESVAIVQYLAEKFQPTLAGRSPEERAQALRWTLWTMLNVQKPLLDMAMRVWMNAPDEGITTASTAELSKQLPILEAHLAEQAFVAGDQFTTGDLCAAVTLTYGKFSQFSYEAYPNITRWMAVVMDRPAYQTATTTK